MPNENSGSASASSTAGFDPEYLRVGQRIAETFTLRSVIPTALGEFPVWLAEDDVMGRQVCLHFIPAEVATDEDLRGVLREEVRKTRQLIHPNILRVHELLEGPDWAAIVTDAYDGESLARQLQEAPSGFFESNEVQPWVQTVVDTLKDVHSVPVLHRNISPADLILSADGRLMLSNFGTRRAIVDALRRAGVKEGKYLSYTSPQVLDGAAPTVSDDVYSLGATLFQMLTGKRIFEGNDVEEQIRSERPPGVIELRHKLNRDGQALFKNWERTIAQALSKDAAERPINVGDLTQKLGMVKGAQPEPEPTPAPAPKAAAAVAAAAAAKAYAEKPDAEPAPVAAKPEPEHMGATGDGDQEEHVDEDVNERVSTGGPRPLLTSFPPEPSREKRKTALVALLVAAGVVGAWLGASFFISTPPSDLDEDDLPVVKPMAAAKDEEAASDLKFVAPGAPGSTPELTALRPGAPMKQKAPNPDALDTELAGAPTPLAVEPAPKTAAPGPLAMNNTPPPPAPPAAPVEEPDQASKQALEAARKKAEAAKLEAIALKEKEAVAKREQEKKEQEALAKKEQEAMAKKEQERKEQEAMAKKEQEAMAKKEQERKDLEALAKKEQEQLERIKAEKAAAAATPPPAPLTPAPMPPAKVAKTEPAAVEPAAPAKPAQFENSLGMKFVPVGDVQFSTCATRVKDYAEFIRETGYPKSRWKSPGFEQGPDHPVVMVSWTDALSFCKWLTDKEQAAGILGPNESYRLPTDVEWSKAAGLPAERGQTPEMRDMGIQDTYPWGTQWPPPPGVGNYTGRETGAEVAIPGYEDGFPHTAPVGSFKPNAAGLYDMGGNVWQWTMDTWNTKARSRVLRGASWSQGALQMSLLSSCRIHSMPDKESDNYGFRVVRANGTGKAR